MKKYYYTVSLFNKTSIRVASENCTYTTSNFIAVCNGDRIVFDGSCWYLWDDITLITSGLISGLSVRKVRRNVNILGELTDFIEYRFTAYDEIEI